MDPKVTFLFYLGAIICFALTVVSSSGRDVGRLGGRLNLVALGLALWLFPSLWDVGTRAF